MLSIKTNQKNKQVVNYLTKKFNFPNEAVIARIAIAYSLQKLTKFNLDEVGNLDNTGKEYKGHNLFNSNSEDLYRSLFNQYYCNTTTNEQWSQLVKLHLDDGLSKLYNLISVQEKNHIDVLIESIKDGLQLLDINHNSDATQKEPKHINACDKEISLNLGFDNGLPIEVKINNQKYNNNQHIAIAGTTGAGKTEFVKDLLWQIHQQSHGELKFIFFDPKGEGKSDKLKHFLDETQCNFINVSQGELSFNPLSHINLIDENLQRVEIQGFRDAIASVNYTGPTQKKNLSEVLRKIFINSRKNGEHPTIKTIKDKLDVFYKENNIKHDNLTAIFDDIADWFKKDKDISIYDSNCYINLPATMPKSASQTIIFLILNYLKDVFMSCSDSKTNGSIKSMRYVIVIDEAHVYLNNKKASEILENLLRLIRSRGVMIILLTQGVEDYNQKYFDFTSQIGTSILLDVNDKSNNKYIQKFLGADKDDKKLSECLKNLAPQKGIICVNESQLIDINLFFKRIRNN